MPFILTGFRQVAGSRIFAFENIAKDKTRTKVTVRADINIGRKYGIQLQEWPLLCVEMLERVEMAGCGEMPESDTTAAMRELIFEETTMREFADARTALRLAASSKRKMYKPAPRPLSAFAAAV